MVSETPFLVKCGEVFDFGQETNISWQTFEATEMVLSRVRKGVTNLGGFYFCNTFRAFMCVFLADAKFLMGL